MKSVIETRWPTGIWQKFDLPYSYHKTECPRSLEFMMPILSGMSDPTKAIYQNE